MVLNNYYAWRTFCDNYTYVQYDERSPITTGIKDTTNTAITLNISGGSYASDVFPHLINYSLGNGFSVKLGEGVTDPEAEDYTMEADITSYLVSYNCNHTMGVTDTGQKSVVITVTGINNNSNAITISELGIFKSFYDYQGSTKNAMMVHELLDAPITLNYGQSFSLTFEWIES